MGELSVVARHGADALGGWLLEVLGRIEQRRSKVVPDDHALGAADGRGETVRRSDAGYVEQGAVVRELHEVTEMLARVVTHIHQRGVEEGRRDVGDEGSTAPFLA